MNKWRRIEKRKEERTFRAVQAKYRAVRRALMAAAATAGVAHVRLVAASAGPLPSKVVAMLEAQGRALEAVAGASKFKAEFG